MTTSEVFQQACASKDSQESESLFLDWLFMSILQFNSKNDIILKNNTLKINNSAIPFSDYVTLYALSAYESRKGFEFIQFLLDYDILRNQKKELLELLLWLNKKSLGLSLYPKPNFNILKVQEKLSKVDKI